MSDEIKYGNYCGRCLDNPCTCHENLDLSEMTPEKKSSEQWCQEKGLKLGEDILDPDGWDRKNFEESWAEEITETEFMNRVSVSTVRNVRKIIDLYN